MLCYPFQKSLNEAPEEPAQPQASEPPPVDEYPYPKFVASFQPEEAPPEPA